MSQQTVWVLMTNYGADGDEATHAFVSRRDLEAHVKQLPEGWKNHWYVGIPFNPDLRLALHVDTQVDQP